MKKSKLLIPLAGIAALGATVAPLVTLSSCKENPTMVTVTFDYGLETEQVEVTKGGKVAKPTDPKYDGAKFIGWYKDKAWTEAFDFDKDTVSKTTTLYAAWEIEDVKSIELNTEGATRIYTYGDRFSLEGLIITATFEDGSRRVIPNWACTSDIPEGAKLTQHGFQDVTITVGDVSRKYEILVNAAVTSMKVTTTRDLSLVAVGETIYRRNFEVNCTYSDGSEGTLLPLQWQSNIFPDGALSYTFTEPGSKEIRITYADQEWTSTSYAYLDNDYELNLPTKFILPVNTSGTGDKYTSRKELTILSDGTPISSEGITYKFSTEEAAKAKDKLSVRDGVIYALAPTDDYITFSICDSEGAKIVANDIQVKVVNDTNVTIPATGRIADFGAYQTTDAADGSICVIPDAVSQNDAVFAINLVDGEGSALANTDTIYLPHNLYSIEQYAMSAAPKLQNIYFDGTKEEFNNVEKLSLWYNDFVTAVECIDDVVPVDGRSAKAKFWYDESISKFEMSTDPFNDSYRNATLQFDLAGVTDISTFTGIKLYGYTHNGTTPTLYADCVALTPYDSNNPTNPYDFKFEEDANRIWTITFNSDTSTQAHTVAGKNVVIKCPGLFSKNGYAACVSNILPTSIRIDNHWRVYHVGDTFTTTGLKASWVWADGSSYPIPTQYLTASGTSGSGQAISFGYKFVKGDITPAMGGTPTTITITDSVTSKTATYDIQIQA